MVVFYFDNYQMGSACLAKLCIFVNENRTRWLIRCMNFLELLQLILCQWATFRFNILRKIATYYIKTSFWERWTEWWTTVLELAGTRVFKIQKQVTRMTCIRYFSSQRNVDYMPQQSICIIFAFTSKGSCISIVLMICEILKNV